MDILILLDSGRKHEGKLDYKPKKEAESLCFIYIPARAEEYEYLNFEISPSQLFLLSHGLQDMTFPELHDRSSVFWASGVMILFEFLSFFWELPVAALWSTLDRISTSSSTAAKASPIFFAFVAHSLTILNNLGVHSWPFSICSISMIPAPLGLVKCSFEEVDPIASALLVGSFPCSKISCPLQTELHPSLGSRLSRASFAATFLQVSRWSNLSVAAVDCLSSCDSILCSKPDSILTSSGDPQDGLSEFPFFAAMAGGGLDGGGNPDGLVLKLISETVKNGLSGFGHRHKQSFIDMLKLEKLRPAQAQLWPNGQRNWAEKLDDAFQVVDRATKT
uniref:Uncharacterized protein n=1 Tax=Solanum lycopersicum TaxID=4081 RepID=A0A3Q7F9I7_SOLLC